MAERGIFEAQQLQLTSLALAQHPVPRSLPPCIEKPLRPVEQKRHLDEERANGLTQLFITWCQVAHKATERGPPRGTTSLLQRWVRTRM